MLLRETQEVENCNLVEKEAVFIKKKIKEKEKTEREEEKEKEKKLPSLIFLEREKMKT